MAEHVRRLGEGYEPHVDELDGRLVYGLPIDSSIVTFSLDFEIADDDLRVLKADEYRRAALHWAVHTVMQTRGARLEAEARQALFRQVADRVLFADEDGLRACIAEIDEGYNIRLDHFIQQDLARWRAMR